MLEEHPLDPDRHDRAGFSCGVPELDEYLQRFATQHRRRGVSNAYVLVDSGSPRLILGLLHAERGPGGRIGLAGADRRKLPRYPVPCFRMGRLACRADRRGQGLGRLLIACAVERCLQARRQVGGVCTDRRCEKSARRKLFYQHYGFTPCIDAPMTLYLPLG